MQVEVVVVLESLIRQQLAGVEITRAEVFTAGMLNISGPDV